jgi:hypothetical protein
VGTANRVARSLLAPACGGRTRPSIGNIQYHVGSVTLTSAEGVKLYAGVAEDLHCGTVIDTGSNGRIGLTFRDGTAFCLEPGTRMVLDEFACGDDGAVTSAQFSISRGRFAFVASKSGENLTIDTPFARIRGSAHGGAVGVLTLIALTFVLMQDLRAAAPDLEFVLDDLISYKDMEHGTFQLIIKGAAPRTINVDDPGVTVVVNPNADIQTVENTPEEMAALLAASQDAYATYV